MTASLHRALRLVLGVFWICSSGYALLAYLPYTYFSLILAPPVRFMPWFAQHQPELAVVLSILGVLAEGASGRGRLAEPLVALVQLGLAGWLWAHPVLAAIPNDPTAFGWSVVFLAPVIVTSLAAIAKRPESDLELPGISLAAAAWSGLLVAVFSAAGAYLRSYMTNGVGLYTRADLLLTAYNLALNVMLALALASAYGLLRPTWVLRRRPARLALAVIALTALLERVALSALTFPSHGTLLYSLVLGTALTLWLASLWPENGAAGLLSAPPHRWVLILGATFLLGLLAPAALGGNDWNSLALKVTVLIQWLATGIAVCGLLPAAGSAPGRRRSLVTLAGVLAAHGLLLYSRPAWPGLVRPERMDIAEALVRYSLFDPSFKLARDLTAALEKDPCDDFCGFLRQNADIPAAVMLAPPRLALVDEFAPIEHPPDIFIVVIDSLRPDYLSPYAPRVDFTPNIQAFAAEATVFPNAYSIYSGTSLAVPALWAGAWQLHKHFVLPFAPLNNLARLAQAGGYHGYISREPVLRTLLPPAPWYEPLQREVVNWPDLDLCGAVAALDHAWPRGARQPVFFFAQPGNVHRISLARRPPTGPPVTTPGFAGEYATAVRNVDACFGDLLRLLRARGRYEESIIVLTSDHGEALGELGRYGHSSMLYPEALRIPLLVHLPRRLRDLHADPEPLALLTDVTPTLYYLLGQRQLRTDPIFGKPLFTATAGEQVPRRRPYYLVAADTGAAFGILAGDASSLFISNSITFHESFYDLRADPRAAENRWTEAESRRFRLLIRDELNHVADVYGYRPGHERPGSWLDR